MDLRENLQEQATKCFLVWARRRERVDLREHLERCERERVKTLSEEKREDNLFWVLLLLLILRLQRFDLVHEKKIREKWRSRQQKKTSEYFYTPPPPALQFLSSINPIFSQNRWCSTRGSAFFSKSACISAVGTYCKLKFPANICSRIQWYWTSMCFDRAWKTGFSAKAMALSLLFRVGKAVGRLRHKYSKIVHSHARSFPASTVALYSASVEDRLIVGCFLDIQLTAPPFSVNAYPVVERLVTGSPAQSVLV